MSEQGLRRVRQNGRWVWVLDLPETCPQGHRFGPGKASLTWQSCLCDAARFGGHHAIRCGVCDSVVLWPECEG